MKCEVDFHEYSKENFSNINQCRFYMIRAKRMLVTRILYIEIIKLKLVPNLVNMDNSDSCIVLRR